MPRTLAPLLGTLLMLSAAGPADAQPAGPDRVAYAALKDVHNRGADLYNNGDPAGCYRLYQGALLAVRPFLSGRPAVQLLIDDGLTEVGQTQGVKIQAFRLHEVIEAVRSELKAGMPKSDPAGPPTAKTPMTRPTEMPPVAPPVAVAPTPPKPAPPKPPEPPPAPKPAAGTVSGKVVLDGKPLGGADLTFVSVDLPEPRVLTATTKPDGTYLFAKPLPAGKYAVMASGPGVAGKFGSTATSGLVAQVGGGDVTLDFALAGK